MSKYEVTIAVTAFYKTEVEASSAEEAKAVANDAYNNCDIGDFYDVNGRTVACHQMQE